MILLLLLVRVSALPAQRYTINGYISDKKTGEKLLGASVFIEKNNTGTTSNAYGFYSLTLPAQQDSLELRISYTGYTTFSQKIVLRDNLTLNVGLVQQKELESVTLRSVSKTAVQNRTQMSTMELPVNMIKSLPAFLGEVDVMKAIQLLPGVQAGTEGSSGLYVRGGSPDQNLILLDGVPVYNVSHLFGFFSVFNADALNSVEVMKGGFPARYGGRLSSVIDIRMKEGNKNEFHGEGSLGLVASRLMLEGPLGKKKKVSWMISGRRTYIDLLARPLIRAQTDGNVTTGYFFYDLNGKINFNMGPKDHLYLSGYFGNDKFYAREKETTSIIGGNETYTFRSGLKWGNATAVARWNHEFNRKLFGNMTVYFSRYNFDVSAEEKTEDPSGNERFLLKYLSGIRDWSARYDIDYLPNPNHFIKAGFSATAHYYKPGALQSKISSNDYNEDTLISTGFIRTRELDLYAEDDIRISPKFKSNIGVHATGFSVKGKFFHSIQPRLSVRYLVTPDLSVKVSYVQMSQYIHLLTNSGIGLPTDLWVPVTNRVPPQHASQYAIGAAYNLQNKFEFTLEGYYKNMKNVIEYAEGASYLNATSNWEDKVETGRGWSYGAEFFLQKKKGKTTGMLGYTLSWTNRRFAKLNNGQAFPYKYDRRHDLKIALVHKVSDRFEISADWVFGTGQAVTLPTGVYLDDQGNEVETFDGRNGFRMRNYHRFDLSCRFSKQKKHWERAWVLSVYNLYNRKNPFYLYRDSYLSGNTVFKQVSLFPVIPSISYQVKF